jgi:hypothetical protein
MAKTVYNEKIGTDSLCAWQVAQGVVWLQTRDAEHGRRLAQRKDGRLVVRGVAGGYLRTFEFPHSLAWAKRLMARYTSGKATPGKGRNVRQPRKTTAMVSL